MLLMFFLFWSLTPWIWIQTATNEKSLLKSSDNIFVSSNVQCSLLIPFQNTQLPDPLWALPGFFHKRYVCNSERALFMF